MRKPPREEPYAYVKRFYGVNPVIGARVASKDSRRAGVVVSRQSYDHYVYVRVDGTKHAVPYHPLDLDYEVPA